MAQDIRNLGGRGRFVESGDQGIDGFPLLIDRQVGPAEDAVRGMLEGAHFGGLRRQPLARAGGNLDHAAEVGVDQIPGSNGDAADRHGLIQARAANGAVVDGSPPRIDAERHGENALDVPHAAVGDNADAADAVQHLDHPVPEHAFVVGAAAYRAITGWGAASTGVPGPSAEVGRPVLSVASLLGRSRPAVRVVQAGLNRVVGVEIAVDGLWGPHTQAAYTVFRRHMLGLVGRAALGPPTRASLVSLGRMSGFTVVS